MSTNQRVRAHVCHRIAKFLLIQLPLAAVVVLATAIANADVQVGDSVQFERAGQKFTGKVVGLRPGGTFVEVETSFGGRTRKLIVKASSVTPLAPANASKMRTWKDATGRFEIEATLVSQTPFEVVLQKKDGTKVTVPLDKLSVADQEFVAGLDNATGSENPFQGSTMSPPSSGGTSTGSTPGTLTLPAPATFQSGASPLIQKLTPPKDLEADPSPFDFSEISSAGMRLPKEEFFADVSLPLPISPEGTQLCYGVRSPRNTNPLSTTINLIDGKKRTTRKVATIQGHQVWLCAADPESGDVLGVVRRPGDSRGSSLCVISGIREGAPRIVAHWKMFPKDEKKTDNVAYRRMLSNQIVVTVYAGMVRAFDYGAKREVWTLKAAMFNEPDVSAGGRYAACMSDNQVAIIETKTGEQIGSIPVTALGPVALGFSPDGLRLALANGTILRVFDARTGVEQMVHEANVSLAGMGKQVLWLDDEFLLMPTGLLLTLKHNLIAWKYMVDQDALEFAIPSYRGLLMFKGRESAGIIRLPHEAARTAAEQDTSGIAAVKAGDAIAIMANASGPGVSANDLRNWLTQAVTQSGYQPAASAPTQLVASITRGKTKTQSYHVMGRGFGTEEVSYTPYISKVEIRQQGKVLWQQSRTTSLPFMISGNKSLQQTARESEKPDVRFFQGIRLPAQILKPEFQNGFGSSRVSATGVADTPRS